SRQIYVVTTLWDYCCLEEANSNKQKDISGQRSRRKLNEIQTPTMVSHTIIWVGACFYRIEKRRLMLLSINQRGMPPGKTPGIWRWPRLMRRKVYGKMRLIASTDH